MAKHFGITLMIVAVSVASACSDATPPRPEPVRFVQPPDHVAASRAPTASVGRPTPPIRTTPAAFHASNRQNWVGTAHNLVLDKLRDEIRRNKPRDLCKVLERIVLDDATVPGTPPKHRGLESRRDRELGARAVGCGRGRSARSGDHAGASALLPVAFAAPQSGADVSPAAWGLIAEIDGAFDGAATAGDLANSLAGISAAAQALGSEDASVVDAMASVALSSFEYWEQNAYAAAADFSNAYGECLARRDGENCFLAARGLRSGSTTLGAFQLASFAPRSRRVCDMDWRSIGKADLWGAGVGLSIGLKYATSPQGAIGGLLGGAAVASGGAFLFGASRFAYCLYHK